VSPNSSPSNSNSGCVSSGAACQGVQQESISLASLETVAKALWPKAEIISRPDSWLLAKIDIKDFPTHVTWKTVTEGNQQLAEAKLGRTFPIDFAVPIPLSRAREDVHLLHVAVQGAGSFCSAERGTKSEDLSVPWKLVYYKALFIAGEAQYQPGLEEFAKGLDPRFGDQAARFVPIAGDFYLNGETLPLHVLQKLGVHPLSFTRKDGKRALGSGMDEPVEIPKFEYSLRGAAEPVVGKLILEPNLKGGYDFVNPADAENSASCIPVSVCAVQWIGCGTSRYVYHSHDVSSNETKPGPYCIEFDIKVPGLDEKYRIFQDIRYADKAGIFLDTKFQSGFLSTPVGGYAKPGVALERDRLLLEHGAVMSGITIAEYPLFSKKELDEVLGYDSGMICDQLCIQQRVVLDDTRRLSVLAREPLELSRLVIKSISGADVSEDPQMAATNYLVKLASTIGKNINVCLQLGITTKPIRTHLII
jgi:hypothetical protein